MSAACLRTPTRHPHTPPSHATPTCHPRGVVRPLALWRSLSLWLWQVVQVSLGEQHALARTGANGEGAGSNGEVYVWGQGYGGRLGGAVSASASGGVGGAARGSASGKACWAPAVVPGLRRCMWVSVSPWGRPQSVAIIAPAAVS